MKKTQPGKTYFFVDESGDPTFYDRKGNLIVGQEGCSSLLILGLVEIVDPGPIRQAILRLQSEIVNDPYFKDYPSIQKTKTAFHAKDDVPEVRYQFYKLLTGLDFQAHFVVARKIEPVFRNSFNSKEHEFYDHLITLLFDAKLHLHEHNLIYYAKRGSRSRQAPIESAIEKSIKIFEQKWRTTVNTTTEVQAQTPTGEPCLSIIDYMNWAVFRAFTRKEMRYFETVREKVSLLIDIYDTWKYPKNWYSKKNPFHVNKITPL
ncbi:MAG: hypothetical protein C0401_10725 [Anaerolinea sp.]|nr:hypothetical protein [Anaerolinea sp.]